VTCIEVKINKKGLSTKAEMSEPFEDYVEEIGSFVS
jgi:hypothetical protein